MYPHYGGVTEKRRAHYLLTEIRAAFCDSMTLNRTYTSKTGASALGMTDADVVGVIQSLTNRDLHKSMTSLHDRSVWQDVYLPTWNGVGLYVKFTVDAQGNYLLISFKEATE